MPEWPPGIDEPVHWKFLSSGQDQYTTRVTRIMMQQAAASINGEITDTTPNQSASYVRATLVAINPFEANAATTGTKLLNFH